MKFILLFGFLVSCNFYLAAQFKSKEELDLGSRLKTLYPAYEACATTSKTRYKFDIDKKDSVTAIKLVEEEFVGLKDKSSITIVEGYNHFSKIDLIRTFTKFGKTYSPDHAKRIIDSPYYQSAIFDDDNRFQSFSLDFFTFGEKAKYEISTTFNDVKYINTAFFNTYYPVEENTIIFEIPDWLQLDLKEYNFNGFDIVKKQEHDDITKITTITYSLSHCIATKKEKNAPNPRYSWPHIVIVPQKFTTKKGESKLIFSSTDDLYNWYAFLVGKTKNDKAILSDQVKKLTEGKTTDIEKIKSIYYWVQDNIRYIAFESGMAGFIPESCDKVYTSKYGDCKGMANLLTNMLQVAGYDARLTWIGTKDIPYDYSLPSLVVDNHMICTLFFKDSTYFLDGTENFIALGDYANRIQGRPALIQDGKKYLIKNVPDLPKERNKKETISNIELTGELLIGKASTIFNGESQTSILNAYASVESDKKEELLNYIIGGRSKNYSISNLKTSPISDRENPLHFDYDFSMSNQVITAGGETYVSIDFSHDFEDLMPEDQRQNDFMLEEKIYRVYTTEFEIPKGFSIKYIPEPLNINKADYKIEVNYKLKGNKIILNKCLSIDNGIIKKSEFNDWKKDLKQLKRSNSEQLILIPENINAKN
ncbi:MAG TPA: transglutaminase domain-containing protein [Saprospiraceae bacterium]|nr:transglutaminase domain-containing protein [Saprospiraceae bacterium]